jgi:hypothetical protein
MPQQSFQSTTEIISDGGLGAPLPKNALLSGRENVGRMVLH